jgi:chromosome partitioning protein
MNCRTQFLKNPPAKENPIKKAVRKIAIFNKKGGTGKTTTALNLAASLSIKGYKTLLVDTDSQSNIAASLDLKWPRTLGHYLSNGIQFESCIISKDPTWDIMLSDEDIAHVELNLATHKEREFILRKKFEPIADRYDFIIFDCAPSHSLINKNTLLFVEELIITVSCDYLSVVGLNQVLKQVKHLKDIYKHSIKILGILPTFYDTRNNISNKVIELLRTNFIG